MERLKAKFEDCAATLLPAAQVKKLSQTLDQFQTVKSVRDFMRLLETPAPAQRRLA